jgi:hypothetical protein
MGLKIDIGKARATSSDWLYTECQLKKVSTHHLILTGSSPCLHEWCSLHGTAETVQTANRRWRVQPATEGKWKWLAECSRQTGTEGETCDVHASEPGVRLFPLRIQRLVD